MPIHFLNFPANLLDFQRMFPNEAACLRYLAQLCWPVGFTCEKCETVGETSQTGKAAAGTEVHSSWRTSIVIDDPLARGPM